MRTQERKWRSGSLRRVSGTGGYRGQGIQGRSRLERKLDAVDFVL